MMKEILCFIAGFALLISSTVSADDADRLKALKKIKEGSTWEALVKGEQPWPEEFFPMSTWSEKDIKKMPESYWETLQKNERNWEKFVRKSQGFFEKEYGPSVKSLYDLFLKEQEMLNEENPVAITSPVIEQKRLNRLTDLVYVPAQQFDDFQGVSPDHIRVFSYKLGKLHSTPFDILEFTKENHVVLPSGPEGNPEEGDSVFNLNDKLIFMAVDSGHRVDTAFIRNLYPNLKSLKEVEISYPKENEIAWVYVAAFTADPPEKSMADYGGFVPESSHFYGALFFGQCDSRKFKGNIVPTLGVRSWFSSPAFGGILIDFHERLAFNTRLRFRPVGKRKQDIDTMDIRWRAWFDGNVITYSRASWKLKTILGIGSPRVFNDLLNTAFSSLNYTNWLVPFDPTVVMKGLDIYVGDELNRLPMTNTDILGLRFISSGNRKGINVDGNLSVKGGILSSNDYSWHLFAGLPGTMCMRTYYDESLTQRADALTLEWNDDKEKGSAYFNHLAMTNLKEKSHHFCIQWNGVPFFWDSDPSKYNWDNLDLVLKREDKLLSYSIDGSPRITLKRAMHIPDISTQKKRFKY